MEKTGILVTKKFGKYLVNFSFSDENTLQTQLKGCL